MTIVGYGDNCGTSIVCCRDLKEAQEYWRSEGFRIDRIETFQQDSDFLTPLWEYIDRTGRVPTFNKRNFSIMVLN